MRRELALEALDPPVRVLNIFKRAGYRSVKDVAQADLSSLPYKRYDDTLACLCLALRAAIVQNDIEG